MAKIKRQPSRAQIGLALQQIALLWSKPRPPDEEKAAAGLAPGERLQESTDTTDCTPAGAKRKWAA